MAEGSLTGWSLRWEGARRFRSIKTITTDETIRRTAGAQGLNPKSPSVTEGWRAVQLDVAGQRINELRTLDILGGQLWDQQRIITPTAGTLVRWSTMSKDSMPAASLAAEGAAFGRRHLLPFLLNLEALDHLMTDSMEFKRQALRWHKRTARRLDRLEEKMK